MKLVLAVLTMCLCLPLMGDDAAKKEFEATKAKAEKGDRIAQYNLGVLYDNGEGVVEDDKEAVKWYRKAAEQGHASAQFNLGVMYREGEGVKQDFKEAVKWYGKAAEQGHAKAQSNLGNRYYKGEGVPKSIVISYVWYNIAAANGSTSATKSKGIVVKKMTSAQIAQAEAIVKEAIKKNPKLINK